jgi:hypothetical protein
MPEEFEVENTCRLIPTQVRRLANPCTRRDRKQKGEITSMSVVFVIMGSKVAQSLVKKAIKAGRVWYRVEMYPN